MECTNQLYCSPDSAVYLLQRWDLKLTFFPPDQGKDQILVAFECRSIVNKHTRYTVLHIQSRDDFKTQPAGDRRFRPVSIILNNDNCPEPVNLWLGFEVTPKWIVGLKCSLFNICKVCLKLNGWELKYTFLFWYTDCTYSSSELLSLPTLLTAAL